ncbi:hypothetical protein F5887DRAFT_921569 [Amanita rubescens]|nr:hypothetical protein F5887DRAFT_921569 [Amanita rubescens]
MKLCSSGAAETRRSLTVLGKRYPEEQATTRSTSDYISAIRDVIIRARQLKEFGGAEDILPETWTRPYDGSGKWKPAPTPELSLPAVMLLAQSAKVKDYTRSIRNICFFERMDAKAECHDSENLRPKRTENGNQAIKNLSCSLNMSESQWRASAILYRIKRPSFSRLQAIYDKGSVHGDLSRRKIVMKEGRKRNGSNLKEGVRSR